MTQLHLTFPSLCGELNYIFLEFLVSFMCLGICRGKGLHSGIQHARLDCVFCCQNKVHIVFRESKSIIITPWKLHNSRDLDARC